MNFLIKAKTEEMKEENWISLCEIVYYRNRLLILPRIQWMRNKNTIISNFPEKLVVFFLAFKCEKEKQKKHNSGERKKNEIVCRKITNKSSALQFTELEWSRWAKYTYSSYCFSHLQFHSENNKCCANRREKKRKKWNNSKEVWTRKHHLSTVFSVHT